MGFPHHFWLDSQVTNRHTVAALKVYHPTWLKENQRWWIFFDTIWGRATVNTLLFDIHGTYRLPRDYSFAVLPRNTIVVPKISNIIDLEEDPAAIPSLTTNASPPLRFKRNSDIASSGSALKILASIFQLLFSYYTVYRHQGDQIQRWGYVSFFFTPLPYAIMSFCNGISNLLTPDYAKLYMVHSEIMDEAKEAGGAFEGEVGRVIPLIGPVNDNGYRFGFATTWKGISPTSIKRAISAAFFRFWKKQGSSRTMTPATCTAISKGVDNSYFLQMRSGENGVCSVYKVTLKSASDEELFDGTSERLLDTRLAALRESAVFWFSYVLYCCIRQPQRTARYIKKWNSNPRLPVFKIKTRTLPIKPPDQTTHPTIYYPCCFRFQRYDDPIPQKHLAAAITNSTHIISAPATSDMNYPSASSPRSTTGITRSSTLLPVSFGLVLSGVPFIIIAVLSHFQPGSSSSTQRIIILLWWSSGSIIGLLMPFLDVIEILVCIVWLPNFFLEKMEDLTGFPMFAMPHGVFALAYSPWSVFVAPVWGFVIVGQMLSEWGSCISLY